jgi:hypothetical protein
VQLSGASVEGSSLHRLRKIIRRKASYPFTITSLCELNFVGRTRFPGHADFGGILSRATFFRSEPLVIDNRDMAELSSGCRLAWDNGGNSQLVIALAENLSASWRRLQNAARFDLGPCR